VRSLGTTVTTLLVLSVGFSSRASGGDVSGDTNSSRRVTHLSAQCPDAAIREVRFSREVTVDQIFVELSGPESGAIRVEVSTASAARRLIAWGDGGRGLRFSPGLRGDRFKVALDPEFTARAGLCVERVVLLRGGEEIAVVHP
jgi:hypothetical protein